MVNWAFRTSLFPTLTQLRNNHNPNLIVGIRREDPSRIWERRTPLTPEAVHRLSSPNVKFQFMRCSRRVFSNIEYIKAGAVPVDSLTDAQIVLGIKEPPLNDIPPSSTDQTHLMFSHTTKGQTYNTPLLERFLKDPLAGPRKLYRRLIDYELLADDEGKRTIGFGYYAGVAGVLESLSSMAHSHLEHGVASPFLYTPRPHTLPSEESLRTALRSIGAVIARDGTPRELGPFIIGLTGRGRVSQGCLSMLSVLPHEMINVALLESFVKSPSFDARKIYIVHAKPEDYLVRTDGGRYDREHYYLSPQSYTSVFCSKVAPYLTLFLNGVGWSPSYPRLMTNEQLTIALELARGIDGFRFTNIGDISCDVGGGLEFLTKATTLSQPFYKIHPSASSSVQIMSVDILPASIPLDASKSFSSALEPLLRDLIYCTKAKVNKPLPPNLKRATIASSGVLAEKHQWLQRNVDEFRETSRKPLWSESETGEAKPYERERKTASTRPLPKKKILMLGSGMVAAPVVDYIAQRSDVELIIASDSLVQLQELARPHLNVKYQVISINIAREDTYLHLIKEADIVISLLPVEMHVRIAELCILSKKHLITASYVSQGMKALDQRAWNSNVLLLNEIGLDPGIDHCSAASLVKRVQDQNKEIISFTSFCGGLPAPQDSLVPLRYKFSWRPEGVLSATLNKARYLLNDSVVDIEEDNLLKNYYPKLPLPIPSEVNGISLELEGLPNRNSLMYPNVYGLNLGYPNLTTFFRGTLRYAGFSSLMQSFLALGLLNRSGTIELRDWGTFVSQSLRLKKGIKDDSVPPLSSLIPPEDVQILHDSLAWLGLAQPPSHVAKAHTQMPPLPKGQNTPLAIFAYLLSHKLKYQPHETDMVILSHEIISQEVSTSPKSQGKLLTEVHTSTLHTYGLDRPNIPFPGARPASAMARSVGLPLAIASLLILDGKIRLRGVQIPTLPEIYEPILERLHMVGLGMTEETREITWWRQGLTVRDALTKTDELTRTQHAKSKVLKPEWLRLRLELETEEGTDIK